MCYRAGSSSILPPGVISTSLSGLWLRFKVITSALKIEGSQDHPNTFNSKPLCKGHWKGFFWTDVYTCTQSFPNDILGCQQARKIWWRWQLFVHYLLQFLHRVKQKIWNCSRTLLVFLGHVKWVSKKEPHNTFCPTDKCKHFPFSGTVSNSVVSFFSPGFSFLGGKKSRFWAATPFCSLLLSLWVGNAIKTLPFLPHNSRSFAYHCLSRGKKLALKIREEQ